MGLPLKQEGLLRVVRNFSPIIAQQDPSGDGTRNRWNEVERHAEQLADLADQ